MISNGNVDIESQNFKNWFIGEFREDGSPFKTDKFEMKWSSREKGYISPPKENGHMEDRNTLGILVKGKVKVAFLDENKEILLEKEGDYYFSKPTTRHSVEVLADTIVITLRW